MKNNFDKAVKMLIKQNQENRKNFHSKIYDFNFPSMFISELCTVHVNIGRATGKTQFIKNNATKDDLVIAYSRNVYEDCSKHNYHILFAQGSNISHFTDAIRGLRIKNIYIDEPELVCKTLGIKLEEIYNIIWNRHLFIDEIPTFILLGK